MRKHERGGGPTFDPMFGRTISTEGWPILAFFARVGGDAAGAT
jgi:hypothetical protein